jgi:S1-C subfamily serine protease
VVCLGLLLPALAAVGRAQSLEALDAELVRLADRMRRFSVAVQVVPPPEKRKPGEGTTWAWYSGTIVDAKGIVVTTAEAVDDRGAWIFVQTGDETTYRAVVVGSDAELQIGVLAIPGFSSEEEPPLSCEETMRPGAFVMAVGAPYGLHGSVTTGVVSGLKRRLEGKADLPLGDLLQIQTPVNPGDIGGLLADSRGCIVGILAASFRPQTDGSPYGVEGIHFAIPIGQTMRAVARVMEKSGLKEPPPPDFGSWMGINLEEAPYALTGHLGLEEGRGLLVDQVVANGPAARAGLKVLDILWTLGGEPVRDFEVFPRVLARFPDGRLEVEVLRQGVKVALVLDLGYETGRGGPDVIKDSRKNETKKRSREEKK